MNIAEIFKVPTTLIENIAYGKSWSYLDTGMFVIYYG